MLKKSALILLPVLAGYLLPKVDPVTTFLSPYLKEAWQLQVILSSILFLCVLVPYKYHQKVNENKNINLQDFNFIDPPGHYVHPDYPYWICPRCLIEKNKISPVSQIEENFWCCNVCNQPLSGSKGDAFNLACYFLHYQ